MYGDIWLLEQVAVKTGVRQDLEAVFDGNIELVDDIMTLAMFPYLSKYTYNRVARWQDNNRAPSTRELTPSVITRLTQSITEQHRMDLLHRRAMRVERHELCAVDSTSLSAYGDSLADIRWGKNKERLPLAQTTEVVVYTLSSHTPLYFRTFPGNIADSRTLEVILKDLNHSGFKNLIMITDRGYDSVRNLEKFILTNQAMIICTKSTQKDVTKEIEDLGEFSDSPNSMYFNHNSKHFFKQIPIIYEIKGAFNTKKESE
jgi:transposase